jgi:hypothetical protein
MSLLGTLAKVAVGIAVAKGAQAVLKGGQRGQPAPSGGGSSGGLGDILEQLGQGRPGSRNQGGGSVIEDILGQLAGGASRGSGGMPSSGELGDIFKEFTANKQESGGLPDDMSGRTAGRGRSQDSGNTGSFGEILNDALRREAEPQLQPTREQEALAALMLRATLQAAKADGRLDNRERARLIETLGDVSEAERQFVESELQRPVDAKGLANQVPRGLEEQVYAMSVMGIDLDQRSEAQYLHELANAMDLGRNQVNAIHDRLGVPRIYA